MKSNLGVDTSSERYIVLVFRRVLRYDIPDTSIIAGADDEFRPYNRDTLKSNVQSGCL